MNRNQRMAGAAIFFMLVTGLSGLDPSQATVMGCAIGLLWDSIFGW